jgi:hypothetical protein
MTGINGGHENRQRNVRTKLRTVRIKISQRYGLSPVLPARVAPVAPIAYLPFSLCSWLKLQKKRINSPSFISGNDYGAFSTTSGKR